MWDSGVYSGISCIYSGYCNCKLVADRETLFRFEGDICKVSVAKKRNKMAGRTKQRAGYL